MMFMKSLKDVDYVAICNELLPEVTENRSSLDIRTERLPELRNLVYLPHDAGEDVPENYTSWQAFMELGRNVPDSALDEIAATLDCHDVINMQYTSGTTGFPKGVMLTHHNIINNGKCIGDNMKMTPADRLLITVPFFHCFGLVLSIMNCLTHGSTMVPIDVYSPTKVMGRHRKGALYGAQRRADHVYLHAGAQGLPELRLLEPPHRHHGGFSVSHQGHEPGH